MIGSKRNSEFCFPETLTSPRDEAKGNTEVKRKQLKTHCFWRDLSLSTLLAGSKIGCGFMEHNQIRQESKVQAVVSLGS